MNISILRSKTTTKDEREFYLFVGIRGLTLGGAYRPEFFRYRKFINRRGQYIHNQDRITYAFRETAFQANEHG